jgi:CDP-glucose 4,6-dehydratase
MSALAAGRPVELRNPRAVRPWQHVLDPLSGYLRLGACLMDEDVELANSCAEAWNVGPRPDGAWTVGRLVDEVIRLRGEGSWRDCSDPRTPHEARLLTLTSDKAYLRLGWAPTWDLPRALRETVAWYLAWERRPGDVRTFTESQIARFEADARATTPAPAAGSAV